MGIAADGILPLTARRYHTRSLTGLWYPLSYNHEGPALNYLRCYQILQLTPDSSFDLVKAQYRRLAAQHHPDRLGGDDDGQLADINRAYATLRQHYQQHGRLPLAARASAQAPATPFSRPATGPRRHLGWLVPVGVGVALLAGWPDAPHTAPAPVAVTPPPAPTRQAMPTITPAITLYPGDSLGAVIESLGPPSDRRGERWYYGDSWIEFSNGRIINWYASVDTPLPIALTRPQEP